MVVGLDLNAAYLKLARRHAPRAHLSRGDAYQLPYRPGSFDVAYCHFVLLWLARPAAALAEMVRVTRPGGAVLALAEPDYGGRIDYPDELAALGAKQATALKNQGADPILGRRLAALLVEAGLDAVESGVPGRPMGQAPFSGSISFGMGNPT